MGTQTLLNLAGVPEQNGTKQTVTKVVTYGTREEYLGVLTPLNHWIWVAGVMANELAAPFDGVLISLKAYKFVGVLYTCNLCFALLPPLVLSGQRATAQE